MQTEDGVFGPVTDEGWEDMHDENEALTPANIVDKVVFGRRLRALRIMSGYDRVTDFSSALRSRYGVDVSDRTVYAIERGEQMCHIDFKLAVMHLCEARWDWFHPAYRSDIAERVSQMWGGGSR